MSTIGLTSSWLVRFADVPQNSGSRAKPAELQYEAVPLESDGMECRGDIPDLEPGLEYLVRVSAVNSQGPSPPSERGAASLSLSLSGAFGLEHDVWHMARPASTSSGTSEHRVRGSCCVQLASAPRRLRQLPRRRPMSRCRRQPTPCSWSGRSPGAAERLSRATWWTWPVQTQCSQCRARPRLPRCSAFHISCSHPEKGIPRRGTMVWARRPGVL